MPLRTMIKNTFKMCREIGPTKIRTNENHGLEEVRIVLEDRFKDKQVEEEEEVREGRFNVEVGWVL